MSELATTTTAKISPPPVPAGTTALTEDSIAQSLAQDRPTIESAVKTFMIWVVARSLTASATDGDKMDDVITPAPKEAPRQQLKATNAEALSYARALLQAINKFQFNTNAKSTSNVAAVTSQLWNGLVESNKKPARFLGRVALRHAWDGIVVALPVPTGTTASKKEALFISEFGQLLKDYKQRATKGDDSKEDEKLFLKEEDSNAALIWDEPGAELERRRQRRQYRAEDAIKEEERQAKEAMTPMIEEITEEEEEDLAAESVQEANSAELAN
jgi:hypothetical protein